MTFQNTHWLPAKANVAIGEQARCETGERRLAVRSAARPGTARRGKGIKSRGERNEIQLLRQSAPPHSPVAAPSVVGRRCLAG